MVTEQHVARLIGQLYDAGLGTAYWDSALDEIIRAVGAEVSTLFVEDRSGTPTSVDLFSLRGYPDSVIDAYGSYFADRDVRLPAILRLGAGQIYVDDRAMPFAEIERSEIYNDFYRPMGIAHGIGVVPFNDGRRFGILSAHRAIQAGAFRADDIALFEQIAPHVTRALQLHRQVARANAVAGGLAVALNHFQMAVLLIDAGGEVIELNLAAEALLRQPGCPLRVMAKRLTAASSNNAAALAGAIADTVHKAGAVPPVLRLAKTDGGGTLGVMVTPARREAAAGMPGGLALVFVSDPGQPTPTVPDLLASQFGLSPTEARIAARLAAGDRIEEIADARKVSQETVRGQVKHVLAKTDTRSQGQLVSLVYRSLAALRR